MSLTTLEAIDRAERLWGPRVISVRCRPHDDSIEINLTAGHTRASGVLATDTRDRHLSWHLLDANGHAICHADCATLETT